MRSEHHARQAKEKGKRKISFLCFVLYEQKERQRTEHILKANANSKREPEMFHQGIHKLKDTKDPDAFCDSDVA